MIDENKEEALRYFNIAIEKDDSESLRIFTNLKMNESKTQKMNIESFMLLKKLADDGDINT